MRLLRTDSLEFYECLEPFPRYAILSHTWGPEEVNFQEMSSPTQSTKLKAGYIKIIQFCNLARAQQFEYAWIDTCCIDKANLTELSEAINSMFRWYAEAAICYAYLVDVTNVDPAHIEAAHLADSRWFRRGWTLQELIAPKEVAFYSGDWVFLVMKTSFAHGLSSISGVDESLLQAKRTLDTFCVAEKMSWAANRQVTRSEDIAYSLMGIFEINMPLLYGEGASAFRRLQEEILKVSNDQSLLSWEASLYVEIEGSQSDKIPIMAPRPECFNSMIRSATHKENFPFPRSSFTMTNQGLHIRAPVVDAQSSLSVVRADVQATHYAVLDCEVKGIPIAIPLISISPDLTYFTRAALPTIRVDRLERFPCTIREIVIRAANSKVSSAIHIEGEQSDQRWTSLHLERRRVIAHGVAIGGDETEKLREILFSDLAAHLVYFWLIQTMFLDVYGWREGIMPHFGEVGRANLSYFGFWFYLVACRHWVDVPRAAVAQAFETVWPHTKRLIPHIVIQKYDDLSNWMFHTRYGDTSYREGERFVPGDSAGDVIFGIDHSSYNTLLLAAVWNARGVLFFFLFQTIWLQIIPYINNTALEIISYLLALLAAYVAAKYGPPLYTAIAALFRRQQGWL